MRKSISSPDLETTDATPTVPLLTLALWILCFIVGFIGLVFPYNRPKLQLARSRPTHVELIQVELAEPKSFPEINSQPAKIPQPASKIPDVPPIIPLVEPSVIAFASPVEPSVKLTNLKSAEISGETRKALSSEPLRNLTFGRGEGKQPAPEYPTRARREGQEGIVIIQFQVDENGRVIFAKAISPSRWPLLNESAVRTVREYWRFAPGDTRLYEVAIQFQLRK